MQTTKRSHYAGAFFTPADEPVRKADAAWGNSGHRHVNHN